MGSDNNVHVQSPESVALEATLQALAYMKAKFLYQKGFKFNSKSLEKPDDLFLLKNNHRFPTNPFPSREVIIHAYYKLRLRKEIRFWACCGLAYHKVYGWTPAHLKIVTDKGISTFKILTCADGYRENFKIINMREVPIQKDVYE